MTTGLIDLGELPPDAEPAVLPARRRPLRPRRVGLALAAVVVALCGAAAAVTRPPIVRAFSIGAPAGAQIVFVGDRAYVADTASAHPVALAYDLTDGELLWRTPLTLPASNGWSLTVSRHSVLLNGFREYDESVLIALDAADGAVRWQVLGSYTAAIPHLDAFLVADLGLSHLRLVDEPTGRTRWATEIGTECLYDLDDAQDPRTLVEMCESDHTVRTVDVATGQPLTTVGWAALGVPPDVTFSDDRHVQLSFVAVDGMLVVAFTPAGEETGVLVGARLGGPAAWRVSMRELAYQIHVCDGTVCEDADSVTWVHDARTGATTGTLTDTVPVTGGPLDVSGSPVTSPPAAVLVARAYAFDQTGTDSPVTIVADGLPADVPPWSGGHRMYVYVAVPDPSRPLGYRFPFVGIVNGTYALHCLAHAAYLACATAPDTLTFFRLPPGTTRAASG